MYNYWLGCAENGGKVPLASNRMVGSSKPSRRVNLINDLTHNRTFESSNRFMIFKVVISGWGTAVGSVCNSDRIRNIP